ncbi:MAG: relaxase/mobilization nuclease domain-containing protein [Burkholderiales bacterium]|nr:relaxase/mobilization nuclease domain-containing protein [Burkholderiales bacterium]
MTVPSAVDAALVEWGERLFYPRNRIVRSAGTPRLAALSIGHRAAAVRARLEATVLRRAPQVMVKVTGGGRGMAAIAAHFRYIAKAGRLPFEDDRGVTREGKEALSDLVEQWRYGGSEIPSTSARREAFNIILSMPRGTDPLTVQRAAREFAKAEFADHRYAMVLHDHQAHPHVHLSVRAESNHGDRLNPRKADLQRWRETFAERLRGWGIDAEASRQATRGERHNYEPTWRLKARQEGRLRTRSTREKSSPRATRTRETAIAVWVKLAQALGESPEAKDRQLAGAIARYVHQMPAAIEHLRKRESEKQRDLPGMPLPSRTGPERARTAPEIER